VERHVRAGTLSPDTAQTGGMQRAEAVSVEGLWMGQTVVAPSTRSADHHHGESSTAIYVVSGNPRFVFLDSGETVDTSPGDFVYVPPFVPHREENPSPDVEAVVVIARSTQQAIVVNL
jgi:uncharacterized RmlC-like cupin family protein